MENMREYWAREAEMMRDKSAVLGNNSLSQSPSRNEQNTVKGTITFANEFNGSVGAELVAIAGTTSFYKDYVTQLEKQSAYDTYVFTYPAMFIYPTGNGQPASTLYFDNKGFITGEGTRGRTILLTDENDYKQQTGPIGDPSNSYILQRVKLASIKSSFDNKKKVIMVVIANQFLDPEAYPLKKEDLDNLRKKTPRTEYDQWWDNVKLDGTHTLLHELIAHGLNHIKNEKKTEEAEHKAYHGNATHRSPSIPEILKAPNQYANTVMYKVVQELRTEIKKR
jgi:hypothetical protein